MSTIKYVIYYTDELNPNDECYDVLSVNLERKNFSFDLHVPEFVKDSIFDDDFIPIYLPREVLLCLITGLIQNKYKKV